MTSNKHLHLTLAERQMIETGISHGSISVLMILSLSLLTHYSWFPFEKQLSN